MMKNEKEELKNKAFKIKIRYEGCIEQKAKLDSELEEALEGLDINLAKSLDKELLGLLLKHEKGRIGDKLQ